jgi:two-component system OmpR family sensor kinase
MKTMAWMNAFTRSTRTATASSGTTDSSTSAAGSRAWTATKEHRRRLRPRRPAFGLRARIILVHTGLLALAIVASVLVARQLLIVRMEERIDAELNQEVQELRSLARGVDPMTGRLFGGDVRRIFDVFLERNIPSRHEVIITFVNGVPFERSPLRAEPYRLDEDPRLVARWGRLQTTDSGEISTPGGRVKYLAVPVRRAGGDQGVFVVASFRDREEDELNGAIVALAGVGFAILLIGAVLAWRLAGSVLGPVREVTTTARSISETSLERRIPTHGSDEIAHLAATFNDMLDRLQRAFSTQRRLLDDAGHELRTPITIVRGHLEFLEDEPEHRAQTVKLLLDELDRMSRIVDDLLLLAQADEPHFLQLELVNVADFTAELEAKASALGRRNWRVEATGRGIIVADRQRLTQAVMQLAQNAVQHTDEDAEISLGSAVVPGEARFWVRDNGPGIPPDEQERIFERFVRGSDGHRRAGAGLGLAIVRAIATAHNGRVELDSRPAHGATLTIVVPTDQPAREGLPQ